MEIAKTSEISFEGIVEIFQIIFIFSNWLKNNSLFKYLNILNIFDT